MKNVTPWKPAYRFEAREMPAQVLGKFGQNWTAEQVRHGNQPMGQEVQIAMMALMVTRGELTYVAHSSCNTDATWHR